MGKKKSKEGQDARTIDEILDELRNSALNTLLLIVEGRDDIQIYREIAFRHLSASQIAFDFVGVINEDGKRDGGGRNLLLTLFERMKSELPSLKRKVLFFADRDLKIFGTIPAEWGGVHFTDGYSIENDLFADGQPHSSLHADEQPIWQEMIDKLCNWFAGQVLLWSDGRADKMKIDLTMRNLDHLEGIVKIAPDCPDLDLAARIKTNFIRLTRGKHLLELLWHIHHARPTGHFRKEIFHFWQDCINRGLENSNSHTYRISQLLRASAVGSQP